MAPYKRSKGEADGSIMPVIMTAHMAQSSGKRDASHPKFIIHALTLVIGPYMSRAMTAIHSHETSDATTTRTTTGVRSRRNADSRTVDTDSSGAECVIA